MIKIIDDKCELLKSFKDFCNINSFGTRIYSHFLCYGHNLSFVDFWLQINADGNITSAMCRFESDLILCLSDESDFSEISTFISFVEKSSVTFDYKYKEYINIDSDNEFVGDILMYKKVCSFTPCYDIATPEIKEYHNLLKKCESPDFFVPEYLSFLSDVSRRMQHNLGELSGIKIDNELVSCAMTVSYTDFSVILGAVATHPQHRKHGYAACVVKYLAQKYSENKNVYIYTTISKNTEFYKSLGFQVSDKWIKFTYGG